MAKATDFDPADIGAPTAPLIATGVREKLAQQIGIVSRAAGVKFSTHPEPEFTEYSNFITASIVQGLLDAGTTSILDLAYYEDKSADLSFFYDKRTAHVYDNPVTFQRYSGNQPLWQYVLMAFESDPFAEKYLVYVRFTKDGIPVFYVRAIYIESEWHEFAQGVIFVATSLVGYAFPGLGTAVGGAVMGAEAAAAYPLIAAAIGNAAVMTALNGGDIQAGVIASLATLAGQGVGNVVRDATSSAIIAQAAAAATKALAMGGDIQKAVGQSLLSSGISAANAGSLFSTAPVAPVGGTAMDYDTLYSNLPDADFTSGNIDFEADYGLDANGNILLQDDNALLTDTWPAAANAFDFGTPLVPIAPAAGGTNPVVATGWDGASLTNAALTALKLVAAYNQAGSQAPRTSSTTTKANANGTLTQMTSAGGVITSKMPVGTPYLAANGNLVVNNGDGTYTTTNPQGVQTRTAYPLVTGSVGTGALASLMQGNTPIYIGGALLAFMLLSRGRK